MPRVTAQLSRAGYTCGFASLGYMRTDSVGICAFFQLAYRKGETKEPRAIIAGIGHTEKLLSQEDLEVR